MGFNGGGGGQLLNHRHDGGLVADGGPLETGFTQFGLNDLSLLVSDGVNIQELVAGAALQTPRINAAGNAWEFVTPTPAYNLLAYYTGSNSNHTIAISPTVDLATEYSEIIVIGNLYTNSAAGFGDVQLWPNGGGGTFTTPYGYSLTTGAITSITIATTTYHPLALPAMTTTNSGLHFETHISLAKTSTTTNTVYMKTDSISDQGRSEHWENTVDLGTSTLSSLQFAASTANWALGSNVAIYGVKYA